MTMRAIILTTLVLGISAAFVFGQDSPISVETNLVTMNVTVTDKNGNFVRGLKKDDFALTDDGASEPIEVFSADDGALSIGIVYDMHAMDDRAASVLEALKRFTGRLGAADDYFVTVFNERGSLTAEIVPDTDQLLRHLADPEKGTAKSLFDAIFAAADRTAKLRNTKKYLIVISDGADKNSQHNMKDLRQRLRSINVPLYSLIFTPENSRQYGYFDVGLNGPRQAFRVGEATELDRGVIAELSGATGGQAFESNVRNRVYLAALATKFLEEARSQYVIGFYPDSKDGRWRKLRLSVNGGRSRGLHVSTRKGYQSTSAAR
jgi:Ca-activated chloride channel family protein